MKIRPSVVALVAAGCLNACGGGGGGGGGGGPLRLFTVGGTVSGTSGAGLVLQLNGGAGLSIGADGPFTFPTLIAQGSSFLVTVTSSPATETCVVSGGSGPMPGANVTNVAVTCSVLTGFLIEDGTEPLASQQWHLKNTGQNAFSDTPGTATFDIHVDPVFGLGYTGAGVTVAIPDTGLEIAHEDLAANVISGGSWNFNFPTSGNSQTDPTNTVDTDGDHGTSVAGLIAMARNGLGGLGVAPSARLKGFNILSVPALFEQQFLDAIGGSSANPNSSDVFIFNQSFGITTNAPLPVDPAEESQYLAGTVGAPPALALRAGRGALYVKAAGNGFVGIGSVNCTGTGLTCENANFDPTNTLPYQVVVGAVNADGVKASYSTAGSAIWVSAPGGEFGLNASVFTIASTPPELFEPAMVTTDQSGCTQGLSRTTATTSLFNQGSAPNTACNYTNTMNGTSSATPVTVGVIALMLEANPALTWRDVKHILASTARQIDSSIADVTVTLPNPTPAPYIAEPAWTTNHAIPTPFHYHDWYGFGMVDASAAVNMAKTYTLGQLGTFTNTGFIPPSGVALNLAIPNLSATGASSGISVLVGPSFVEAVQIRVSVTHPAVGELGIELTSPGGTRSILKNITDGYFGSANLSNQIFLSNAFYGESAVGTWTIKVVDGFDILPGNAGKLTNWAIRVYGH